MLADINLCMYAHRYTYYIHACIDVYVSMHVLT